MDVAGVRRALEANRVAYEALRAQLHAGMTERDARRIVGEAVGRVCGAEDHAFVGDFVGGARAGSVEGPATDYALRPGDAFICDLSVRRGGTWSDTCRTFFVGEPTDAQRRAYETVVACQVLGEGLVRPGKVFEDVKAEVEAFLAAKGYGGRMPHHVGHLVGPEPYMKPAFEPGEKSVVEPGVVCTLEPGVYFAGDFGIRVENDYLVTDGGVECLFDYPRDIGCFIVPSGKE